MSSDLNARNLAVMTPDNAPKIPPEAINNEFVQIPMKKKMPVRALCWNMIWPKPLRKRATPHFTENLSTGYLMEGPDLTRY